MAINIKFDLVGNPEPPTIILKHRNGKTLGQLDIDEKSIDISDKFNDASEFSFTMNKYINDKVNHLWDKVVDFKLVYCKEWNMHFEIKVELDEATETVKTVFCTQLGQAELSQIKLYNIEINTEEDIARDDYKISILYDPDNPDASILHRLLKDKAPHYRIAYVSPTIAKIQRSFSFDGTSIHDAFEEVGEEIGCLFDYPSNAGANGKIQRDIYVYDLQQTCNDCGHRGEYTDKCPKCGSTNITKGHGVDTLIFVTSDELASSGIQLVTDTDSVKNCFKLEAGDDLMTATVRNCNPNGTDYIWRFSDDMKEDMSDELVRKLESYNKLYEYYQNEHISDINSESLNKYNTLVSKYAEDNEDLKIITTPIQGYSSLMNAYYNTVDLALYLKSVLMPFYDGYLVDETDNFLIDEKENFLMYKEAKMGKTNAEEQGLLLETSLPSLIAVTNLKTVSKATADSTILAMAKAIVSTSYKVEIKKDSSELIENKVEIDSSELVDVSWKGIFIITNYSNEEDTYTTSVISRTLTDWDEEFIKQKIDKMLSKENTDDLSITGLFKKELVATKIDTENGEEFLFSGDFYDDLKHYALNPLISFRDACQSCMDILIEQGVGNNDTWADTEEGAESNLYEKLYVPYFYKLLAIESEIKVREKEINDITGIYDSDGNLTSEGIQNHIEKCRNKIQDALNFEKYLGTELWLEFCAYRREDKYSNDNYISDGLDNAELFKRALEFFEVAENEIYKSSELQHSISTTLNNLLAIPKFKPLVDSFKVGNWIRVQVDGRIYKLRLLEYSIDYSDFENISVEFSDVTKIKNGITDVESILSQASSMATSYSSVKRQASQGEKSNVIVSSWVEDGLNATNTKIIATDNQNQVWDKNGILCREYDPVTEKYSDEQLKIINSTIAVTDDNWKTTKTAIGKYSYSDPITGELKTAYGVNGETIVGKLLIGEDLVVANSGNSLVFNDEGLVVEGRENEEEKSTIVVTIRPDDSSVFTIKKDFQDTNINDEYILHINSEGNLSLKGDITANRLTVLNADDVEGTINVGNIGGLHPVATSGDYDDLLDTPTKLSQFTNDKNFIDNSTDGLINYYKKTEIYSRAETNSLLSAKANASSLANVAISGSYNDLSNTPTKLSQFTNDTSYITNNTSGLTNYYNKTQVDNLLSTKANANNLAAVATSGSYNDLVDIDELKEWILEQIQSAISQ